MCSSCVDRSTSCSIGIKRLKIKDFSPKHPLESITILITNLVFIILNSNYFEIKFNVLEIKESDLHIITRIKAVSSFKKIRVIFFAKIMSLEEP